MTATDALRALLDERGVEWRDSSDENVIHTTWNDMSCWFNEFPDGWTAWGMAKRGTPEQAIEATLGSGTCEVEGYDDGVDEGMDGEWYSYGPPTWHLSCGHETYGSERPCYCSTCGRKVEQ